MNDIKNPKTKKPMIYYYVIALLVFMLLNTFLFPSLFRRTEREVDYSTFMNQLNEGQIQQVEVQDQKIEYILKDQEDWNIWWTNWKLRMSSMARRSKSQCRRCCIC